MSSKLTKIGHWVACGHVTKDGIYAFAGVECINTLKVWLNKSGNFESLDNHVSNLYAQAQRIDKRTGF